LYRLLLSTGREFVKKVVDTPMDYSLARVCAAAVDEALAKSAAKS